MPDRTVLQAFELLQNEDSISISTEAYSLIKQYAIFLRRWNDSLSLVSAGDLPLIETAHLVDALSLAPYVKKFCADGGSILDIGSGGGFPIIPLKCLFPDIPCTLVERSTRKVGFLHRVVTHLNFSNTEIIHGAFPDVIDKITASIITARAVERPEKIVSGILSRLPKNGAFLCQFAAGRWTIPKTFHVEHIDDSWTHAGLRRGNFSIITRQQ
ncbi:MAG: class I SAM-dependent methyltransferase [Candidatus Hydrogenedentes bacterium]|nr:class I SAM-dependent methyltransferase [Candidatus Hydrogenedentota bacterium]